VSEVPFSLSARAVFPGVHLFGDDVGLLAHGAGEELGLLEDGSADLMEVVDAEDVAGGGFDEVPQRGLRRQQVAGAADGFDGLLLHLVFQNIPSEARNPYPRHQPRG